MSTSALIHASIEQAINQYLALDPTALEKLTPLHGQVIAIELIGLGRTFYLIPSPDQIQVLAHCEAEPDCVISGTPLALTRLGHSDQGTSQLFAGEITISGDTDLAHQFGKVLGGMEIDWQARLTPYTGSLLAGDLVAFASTAHQWGLEVAQGIGEDLQHFLQKDEGLVPERETVEHYLQSVDEVRDGVERLEARIALLEQNRKKMGNL